MSDLNFENVRLLIADGGGQIRKELKTLLHHQGFRDIIDTANIEVVRNALETNKVDMLISDFRLPGGDTCELTWQIRHHKIGNNPFVVVMTLVEAPTEAEIRRIIESGSDDLVLKPISTGLIIDRIMKMVNQRKKFVVTSDYIGPTRRDKPRQGSQEIQEMAVPNPVRMKAAGGAEMARLQEEIDLYRELINEQKMGRNAIQVAFLVGKLLPLYNSKPLQKKDVMPHIDRLLATAEDIARRLTGTAYDHVGELCNSMVTVVQSIRERPTDPKSQDLRLLPELSAAIETAFQSEGTDTELARDISASVRQRGQK